MSDDKTNSEEQAIRRNRAVISVIVTMLILMVLEGYLVAFKTKVDTVRSFHGICNDGVGWPYGNFIHQLRELSDSGNTEGLSRVLHAADSDSNKIAIFGVWLYQDEDAYRSSITNILRNENAIR